MYLELRNNRKDIVLIKSIDDEGTPFVSFSKPLPKNPKNNNYLSKCNETPCKYQNKFSAKITLFNKKIKISFKVDGKTIKKIISLKIPDKFWSDLIESDTSRKIIGYIS